MVYQNIFTFVLSHLLSFWNSLWHFKLSIQVFRYFVFKFITWIQFFCMRFTVLSKTWVLMRARMSSFDSINMVLHKSTWCYHYNVYRCHSLWCWVFIQKQNGKKIQLICNIHWYRLETNIKNGDVVGIEQISKIPWWKYMFLD